MNWIKVEGGPYAESDLEVVLFEAFDSVEISTTGPVKAWLSQRNWDSNAGNSLFLGFFCILFLGFKVVHTKEVFCTPTLPPREIGIGHVVWPGCKSNEYYQQNEMDWKNDKALTEE